jgi:PAS domain S-box-containing protein
MANSFHGKGEEFADLLKAARQQTQLLRQYSEQAGSIPEELFASSVRQLDALLDALQQVDERPRPHQPFVEPLAVEAELNNRGRSLELLLESNLIGVGVGDLQGNIVDANDTFLRLLGYNYEDVRAGNLNFHNLTPPEYQQLDEWIFEELQERGILAPHEKEYFHKDGKRIPALIEVCLLNHPQQQVLSLILDIRGRREAEEALRASEQRYRTIVDTARDGIWMIDPKGTITFANQRLAEMFGYGIDEMLNRSLLDFVAPDDQRAAQQALDERADGGGGDFDFKFRRKDGSELWVIVSRNTITDPEGRLICSLGMITDITERKKHEEVLKLQAQILDNLTEGVFVSDREGAIILTNPAMDQLFGYEPGSLIGEPLARLNNYSADENTRLIAEIEESLLREGFWAGELINRKKDNSLFLSYCRVTPIETGSQQAWVTTLQDVTDWKQASEQLEEQAALINQSPDAILVRDMQDRVIFWNMGAESLYGWSADEVLGKNIQQLLNGNHVEELASARKQLLESGDWSGELHHQTRDGRKIIVRTRWTLVRDQQGHLQSVLDINTDITKQKEIESRFLRNQRLESIGNLATGIAHDVNNILAPILIAIDVLKLRLKDEDSQHFLAMLKINTQRGMDLINQVLSFAKGIKSPHQLLQLKPLMGEIFQILESTLPKSIRLSLSIAEDLAMVTGDATQIQQVLMNLCTNAQDAMPDGGELMIAASNVLIDSPEAKARAFVKITVADNGMGIPAELLDRIFEPFFTTKEVGKGTGLGLATVLGILRGHEGFIEVNSEPGNGTSFEVYLPANDENQTQQQHIEQPELPFGDQELILLVDDEPILGETMKRILEQFNYRIVIANGGAQALGLYPGIGSQINLALIDIMMPDLDGLTVMRELRKLNPQARIIALSGLDANPDLDEALGSGLVQAFLRKPFTTSTLLKALQQTLHP